MGLLQRLFGSTRRTSDSEDFADQISPRGVRWMLDHLDSVNTEVLAFVEPPYRIHPEQQIFIPNLLAEFKEPQIGIVHGVGGGHAFLRTAMLRDIARDHASQVQDYAALVRLFRQKGLCVMRVPYLHVSGE